MVRIALVGGTGHQGPGLALRWALAGHEVLIGSRRGEKAERVARELARDVMAVGVEYGFGHGINQEVVSKADVVVFTIPFGGVRATCEALRDRIRPGAVVVSPVVPMREADFGLIADLPEEGSAAELIASLLPQARVVAAFHTVSAGLLRDVGRPVEGDVVVCGEDEEAKRLVMGLVEDIPNLRPLDGGPLAYSRVLEALTPLLITMGKRLKRPNLGIKFI
ncbi:NADPH-dependent F420 reductase [Candidatus Bathyarchaeota archaeon]|nr:MAG: NADPH-dependent F420 reductase [Candidatus Bathyarchaeota archaeon]